ncbi:MAG: pyridoxal-phosphate dependent enzyme [Pseudomonadota bacterium]
MNTLSLEAIEATLTAVEPFVRSTPTVSIPADLVPGASSVTAKYELLQVTGTFKARGAMANALALDQEERAAGVTAVSAGNHAIATAFAARRLGIDAKVVMTATAPTVRVERCRAYGAEVVLAPDVHAAFEMMADLVETENRTAIHPFEGLLTAAGTAGVGYELIRDATVLDAVIVPVGGGGLAAGVAAAVKLLAPACKVYGVEPEGADSMSRSLAAGSAQRLARVDTVADSLGAPMAMPISFALCQQYLDDVVRVSDAELVDAMRVQHQQLGLAVEPACAATLAAATGPLATQLRGKHVGLIFCGSNMDPASWFRLVDAH